MGPQGKFAGLEQRCGAAGGNLAGLWDNLVGLWRNLRGCGTNPRGGGGNVPGLHCVGLQLDLTGPRGKYVALCCGAARHLICLSFLIYLTSVIVFRNVNFRPTFS